MGMQVYFDMIPVEFGGLGLGAAVVGRLAGLPAWPKKV